MYGLVDFVHSVIFYISFQCSCVSLVTFPLILKYTAKSARNPAAIEVDSFTPLPLCTLVQTWLSWVKSWISRDLMCSRDADSVPTDSTCCGVTSTMDVHFFLPRFRRICPSDKFSHCQNWYLSLELTGGKVLKSQIPSKFSWLFIISLVVDTPGDLKGPFYCSKGLVI